MPTAAPRRSFPTVRCPVAPTVAAAALACALVGSANADRGVVGWYAQPALAGDHLVFVSEGDLWSVTLDATDTPLLARRLTAFAGAGDTAAAPVFSPDGEQLAFALTRDGNTDVHVMPSTGGGSLRLTFHPGRDVPLTFTADGRAVAFRSSRSHPLGRPELWTVSRGGGMPMPANLGECSLVSYSATGGLVAFTPWSNESWAWRRYRGGTMPDIWLFEAATDEFRRITDGTANDLFPMWLRGRLWFVSDRTGVANLFSTDAEGHGLRQHTHFAARPDDPASAEGLDIRFASADTLRGGGRIALVQGGDILLFDAADDSVRRLNIRLASDRSGRAPRSVDPLPTLSGLALSPNGDTLLLESRGEILSVPVGPSRPGRLRSAVQLTRSSGAREWGVAFLDPMRLVLISDQGGEQQLAVMPPDGSGAPSLLTIDREDWLFPPKGSPDGAWVAFADKTHRLHTLEMATLRQTVVDSADDGAAWEITDYRFSPDSQWLAYAKPMANRLHAIHLHSLRTGRTIMVSDGLSHDVEPRWDPAGRYLYFLSRRNLDPVLSDVDMDHVIVASMEVVAICLAESTPPPDEHAWHAVGLDFSAWRRGRFASPHLASEEGEADDDDRDDNDGPLPPGEVPALPIDADGLAQRLHRLPIDAGDLSRLEAIPGGVLILRRAVRGVRDQPWPAPPLGVPGADLHRHALGRARPDASDSDRSTTLVEGVSTYAVSADGRTIAYPKGDAIEVRRIAGGGGGDGDGDAHTVRLTDLRLRIDPPAEWRQIFAEAWRLQRDFFWAPTMGGIDWPAMRSRHEPSLARIGTRAELDDLLRLLLGELGTSHMYVASAPDRPASQGPQPGLLGADLIRRGGALTIERIHRGGAWADLPVGPLAAPWLGLREGLFLLAIDGQSIGPATNPHALLEGRSGLPTRLLIADDAAGRGRRVVEVIPVADDQPLRYLTWVEANRARVAEASEGRLGYLHLPDMDSDGLVAFNRLFWSQIDRDGLIVDVRNNGGGYVSQMLLQRLARRVWAFMQPRHGPAERYPARALHGPMAVLIDQHAGSDGDIFPESFRILGLGPLIGTRTWGGVVGIRADKPAIDMGLTTQPEFAWWEPVRGWALENSGVTPDIEVPLTPTDRRAQRDPQLERAIVELLRSLAENPMPLPDRPPWP